MKKELIKAKCKEQGRSITTIPKKNKKQKNIICAI